MKKHLIVLLLCLALALSACAKTEIRPTPDGSNAAEPRILTFETTDLYGNAVSSEDLFAAHKLTMVNVWATWCGPCVRELPELGELSEELAAKDCAVVGLLYDGDAESARALMEEAGADYLVLNVWDGADAQLGIQAFPTTFFVDSSGAIVGTAIIGADVEGYSRQSETLLAKIV